MVCIDLIPRVRQGRVLCLFPVPVQKSEIRGQRAETVQEGF